MRLNKFFLIVLAFTMLFVVACDSRGGGVEEVQDPKDNYIIESISAEPEVVYAGATGYNSIITVVVKDENNYAVPGLDVKFKASPIGSVDYLVATDSLGMAKASFAAPNNDDEGMTTIEASVTDKVTASVQVEVIPSPNAGEQYSLSYDNATQVVLDVINTGGNESLPLQVKILKNGQDYLDDDISVTWKMLNAPLGANLGGIPTTNPIFADDPLIPEIEKIYIAPTLNGYSTAMIFSGEGVGTVELEATLSYSSSDGATPLEAKVGVQNIIIQAGEAYNFEIDNAEDETVTNNNATAGVWDIELHAKITDKYNNAVRYGTAVWWSVNRAWDMNGVEVPEEELDWVNVIADSYVENPNANGDSTAGVSYTTLTFDGSHSNDSIEVQVQIGDNYATRVIKLPMAELELLVGADEDHCDIEEGGETDPTSIYHTGERMIWTQLEDDQGNLIHNAKIIMSTNWGVFAYTGFQTGNVLAGAIAVDHWHHANNLGFLENPNIIYTDENGYAEGYILFYWYEFSPPDQQGQPVDKTVTVVFEVSGTETRETAEIYIRKYPAGTGIPAGIGD